MSAADKAFLAEGAAYERVVSVLKAERDELRDLLVQARERIEVDVSGDVGRAILNHDLKRRIAETLGGGASQAGPTLNAGGGGQGTSNRYAAIKRFVVFGGLEYYPEGGWSDFRGSYDSEAEARARENEVKLELTTPWGINPNGFWSQVIDLATGIEVVRP